MCTEGRDPVTRTEGPRIVAYVPPELRKRAEVYARGQGVSVSTIVMLALRVYLDERAPEPRKRKRKP
jgi:hypothetical protein